MRLQYGSSRVCCRFCWGEVLPGSNRKWIPTGQAILGLQRIAGSWWNCVILSSQDASASRGSDQKKAPFPNRAHPRLQLVPLSQSLLTARVLRPRLRVTRTRVGLFVGAYAIVASGESSESGSHLCDWAGWLRFCIHTPGTTCGCPRHRKRPCTSSCSRLPVVGTQSEARRQ